jgi:hypothetical protein
MTKDSNSNSTVDTLAVFALLDQLSDLYGGSLGWIMISMRCARCRAVANQPCVRPNGEPYLRGGRPHYHTSRIDPAKDIARRCPVWLRHELRLWVAGDRSPDCEPTYILHQLLSSELYKLALLKDRLKPFGSSGFHVLVGKTAVRA